MNAYHREINSNPSSLVENGKLQFGCYNKPMPKVNFLEAEKPYKLPLPRFLKSLQLREWQAFQLGNKDYFMLVAIYDAKKLSLVQFIFYDIAQNKKLKYEKKVPSWKLHVPNGLDGTEASYESKDFSLKARHDINAGKLELEVDIKGFGKLPDVRGRFRGHHFVDRYEPMVVCLPFSEKRAMYSHKCLMPMQGDLQIAKVQRAFPKESSYLIIDDHKGYYPFPTRYDWVTAAGYNNTKQLLGFNLTDNQVLDKERYNENALWLDGKLNPLPPIKIQRPKGVEKDWLIKDEYGMVDLVFHPKVNTSVDVNLGLFKSKYRGPYGHFEGYLKTQDGEKVVIENLLGMGEDFYLRV